jgi:hypothetical protein
MEALQKQTAEKKHWRKEIDNYLPEIEALLQKGKESVRSGIIIIVNKDQDL